MQQDKSSPDSLRQSPTGKGELLETESIQIHTKAGAFSHSGLPFSTSFCRWAEELASRDVITGEEILQAHVDAHTTHVPKARLRRKRNVGDPITPDDFERMKHKAEGSELMKEWSIEDFAR
jgi:hypothetical protein